jgi:hypothetical protein
MYQLTHSKTIELHDIQTAAALSHKKSEKKNNNKSTIVNFSV